MQKDETCAQEVVSARDVREGKLELNALQNATLSQSDVRIDFNSKLPRLLKLFDKVKRTEHYFISLWN